MATNNFDSSALPLETLVNPVDVASSNGGEAVPEISNQEVLPAPIEPTSVVITESKREDVVVPPKETEDQPAASGNNDDANLNDDNDKDGQALMQEEKDDSEFGDYTARSPILSQEGNNQLLDNNSQVAQVVVGGQEDVVNQFVSPSKAGPVLTSAQEVRVRLSGENFTDGIRAPPVRMIVSTTRSPRIFPLMEAQTSFEQLIDKKLPSLRLKVDPSVTDLFHMVTALEQKRKVFEQAFVAVKQEQEQELNTDKPNPQLVAFSERLDLIYVRDVDKLIEQLTRNLPMDLEGLFTYFQWSYSLQKTSYTLSLTNFIKIYIEYIEHEMRERKGTAPLKRPFHRASESMTAETLKKYIFSENYAEQQDLISEKLELHKDRINDIFGEVNPESPSHMPLGRLREFWLQLSLTTRCVMVKAGSEYTLGQKLSNDPDCLQQLHEFVCLAFWYSTTTVPKPQQQESLEELKAIIRGEERTWPRQIVTQFKEERDEEADVRPKLIKFADEAIQKDQQSYDEKEVSAQFFLTQIEEFFQTKRSVVLVDLDVIELPPPVEESKEIVQEFKLDNTADPEKALEPEVKKKPIEEDLDYTPPPSTISAEEQKIVDTSLLEVFNFYCRKFTNQRGDFSQLNQNLFILGLQGYTRFAKDFKVGLNMADLTTVWKKSSINHQPHEFEQFSKSVTLLGLSVNRSKVEEYKSRQKLLRKELKQRRQADKAVTKPPLAQSSSSRVAQLCDNEMQGELLMLEKQIRRTQKLSEDQSRIQMYHHMELLHRDRVRGKLPIAGANDLKTNIQQTKRIIHKERASNFDNVSSKVSSVSTVVARLTSNPPPVARAARAAPFVREIKPQRANRGKSQRPVSLLSPASNTKSLKALSNQRPLEPIIVDDNQRSLYDNTIGGTDELVRKNTERIPTFTAKNPLETPIVTPRADMKQPQSAITNLEAPPVPMVIIDEEKARQERQNLADIHKRIRLEKQKTGRVLDVKQAKILLLREEQNIVQSKTILGDNVSKKSVSPRKTSITSPERKRTITKDNNKLEPSKLLPLSRINKQQAQQSGQNYPLLQHKTPSMIDLVPQQQQRQEAKITNASQPVIPKALTFEDLQKMHYTNFNQKDSQADDDDFRPQDFLDLDSGDSDNEILAKFRPERDVDRVIGGQLASPIKQFVPTYLNQHGSNIEEQTGYSNSPKFSVYRLNNQSNLKDGPVGFEEHANLHSSSQHEMQSQIHQNPHNQSQLLYEAAQNEYYPQPMDSISLQDSPKKMSISKPGSRPRKNGGPSSGIAITTPGSYKGSTIPKKVPSHRDLGMSRAKASGRTKNMPYMNDAITSNISEINGKNQDDRTTTLGVLSILNGGPQELGSPTRLPAHQILDESDLKHRQDSMVGEGLTANVPIQGNHHSRQNLQVGSARISGGQTHVSSSNKPQRIGSLAQGKRTEPKPLKSQSKAVLPRYTSNQKLQGRHNRVGGSNYTDSHLMESSPPMPEQQSRNVHMPTDGGTRQSQIFKTGTATQSTQSSKAAGPHQSQLPPQLTIQQQHEDDHNEIGSKKGSAVSSSNQRALMRAMDAQKKESQQKQRRLDGLMNLHEKNMQKGLSVASRR